MRSRTWRRKRTRKNKGVQGWGNRLNLKKQILNLMEQGVSDWKDQLTTGKRMPDYNEKRRRTNKRIQV